MPYIVATLAVAKSEALSCDSFLDKVSKVGCCFIWNGKLRSSEPVFTYKGRKITVRQAMWEKTYGLVPHGKLVRQSCSSSRCINPDHLFITTRREEAKKFTGLGRRPGVSLFERMDGYTSLEPNTGCWLWAGATNDKGYAQIGLHGKTAKAAHVNYKRFKGFIPPDMVIRHTCDVRMCVNPDHLILGTQLDNIQDMIKRERHRFWSGELSPNSSLTNNDVQKIRSLYATGNFTQCEIGAFFNVASSTIGRIVRHNTWREDNARKNEICKARASQ